MHIVSQGTIRFLHGDSEDWSHCAYFQADLSIRRAKSSSCLLFHAAVSLFTGKCNYWLVRTIINFPFRRGVCLD